MKLFHSEFVRVATAALAVLLIAAPSIAFAQTARSSPVRVTVPCSAGSPTDTSARIFFKNLSKHTGLTFDIENFPNRAWHAGGGRGDEALADYDLVMSDLSDCDNDLLMPIGD